MNPSTAVRNRRALGLVGLFSTAGLLVGAKAVTAPRPHKIVLGEHGSPVAESTRRPARSSVSAGAVQRSILGDPVDVGYGTVQVRLSLSGNRIVDVTAAQLPSGGRSTDIAAYAAPELRHEVLAAQSANIDTVSGASYTSEGYARSVQSALDAAGR